MAAADVVEQLPMDVEVIMALHSLPASFHGDQAFASDDVLEALNGWGHCLGRGRLEAEASGAFVSATYRPRMTCTVACVVPPKSAPVGEPICTVNSVSS
jgi:hypothetical protein